MTACAGTLHPRAADVNVAGSAAIDDALKSNEMLTTLDVRGERSDSI